MIIDMQRDFGDPGGFGEQLGNDVSLLRSVIPSLQRVLEAWRDAGLVVTDSAALLTTLGPAPR